MSWLIQGRTPPRMRKEPGIIHTIVQVIKDGPHTTVIITFLFLASKPPATLYIYHRWKEFH